MVSGITSSSVATFLPIGAKPPKRTQNSPESDSVSNFPSSGVVNIHLHPNKWQFKIYQPWWSKVWMVEEWKLRHTKTNKREKNSITKS